VALLLLLDFITNDLTSRSWPLWILLAGTACLTFWECRERAYRPRVVLWWVTFTALTHVVGYLILRFFVRPPSKA